MNSEEQYITGNYAVNAGESYETIPFNNLEYIHARLIVTLGFHEESLAGMAMELWAYGRKVQRILSITPNYHRSITAISVPFNIAYINGFNIVFRNKCLNYPVKIAASKLVMWNDR